MKTRIKVTNTNTKQGVFGEPTATPVECHHYWLIESAKGQTSHGVCKICGVTKEFYNSIPEAEPTAVKRRVPFDELPELDVNPDSEPNKS